MGAENLPVNYDQSKDFETKSFNANPAVQFTNKCLTELVEAVSLDARQPEITNANREEFYRQWWFRSGLFKFQENPVLLDPILPSLFEKLFANLMSFEMTESGEFVNIDGYLLQARYVVYMMHTRKCKKVDKYFPHEVIHLRLILSHFDAIKKFEKTFNEFVAAGEFSREDSPDFTRKGIHDSYLMIVAWLSSLMRIPFSFEKINPHFRAKVIDICKEFITHTGTTGDMACMCLARYYSRSDSSLTDGHITEIIEQVSSSIDNSEYAVKRVYAVVGSLKFLCCLYKVGPKEKLRELNEQVFEVVQKVADLYEEIYDEKLKDSTVQRFLSKLAGRIALTELKARQAKWKYNRGSRILGVQRQTIDEVPDLEPEADEEEDVEISETVEAVLSLLINCLSDSSTMVRWNAAKHLGRVTERLDADNASILLGEILNMLDDNNAENSWHGGCSALAEFSRRNMITQEHIAISITKIKEGLCYDKRRGEGSVGSNVRDAACYASWTFARGFHPAHLKDYIEDSVKTLITTACFDKEVSCRKAAQAALQENIGRLPLEFIPNALDLNQLLNFQTIAQLSSAAQVGAQIAIDFPEYRAGIIEYLATNRAVHWELEVRQAAAKSIATTLNNDDCLKLFRKHLPALLEQGLTKNNDFILHGAVMTLSTTYDFFIALEDESVKLKVQKILDELINSRHFSNPASFSYILRPSILDLLKVYAAEAKKTQNFDNFVEWIDSIQASVMKMGQLPDALVELGLRGLCNSITPAIEILICALPEEKQLEICEGLIGQITSKKATILESARICACYLIKSYKVVKKSQIFELFHLVTEGVRLDTKTNPTRHYFVDLRAELMQYSLDSLLSITANQNTLDTIGETIVISLDDYTRNQRGDIGSHVRLAALKGIQQLCGVLPQLKIETVLLLVGKTLQQGAEKILRVREEAARTLIAIRVHKNLHPDMECLFDLFKIKDDSRESFKQIWISKWGAENMFPAYSKLLKLKSFQRQILQGLIVSAGDLTQSLSQNAFKAANTFMDECEEEQLETVLDHICSLWDEKPALLGKPLLKVLEEFLAREYFEDVEESKKLEEIFELCIKYTKAKDSQNAINAISCLNGMARMDVFYERAFARFKQLLANKKPFIRYQTAEKLLQNYEILSITRDIPASVTKALRETDWVDDSKDIDFFKETSKAIISQFLQAA